jgi:aryl carrier-like protein
VTDTPNATADALLGPVREAWADVLALDSADAVPVDTNFFDAGGNSLLMVMLWEELQRLTDGVLRLSDLFQHSTVRAQTVLLAGGAPSTTADTGAVDRSRLLNRNARAAAAAVTD